MPSSSVSPQEGTYSGRWALTCPGSRGRADAGVDCPTWPTVPPQRQTSGRRSESPDVTLVVFVVNPFILRPPPRAVCCRSPSASFCTSSKSPLRATATCPWSWTLLRPSTPGGRGHLVHARSRDRLGGGRAPGPTAVTPQQALRRLPGFERAVRSCRAKSLSTIFAHACRFGLCGTRLLPTG